MRTLWLSDGNWRWNPALVRVGLHSLCALCLGTSRDDPFPQAACVVHYAVSLRELHEEGVPTLERVTA